MISLVCPTRGREKQFKRMCESAFSTADADIEILSGTNGTDAYPAVRFPLDCPTTFMWNKLAETASGELLMLCADDVVFNTKGWGAALEKHYRKLKDKKHVYSLQDSRDINGTPHPIVTRDWCRALGYFVCPIFFHWYVDTYTVKLARSVEKFTHMRDFLLIHDKPSDRGIVDYTHKHIREMGINERDKYVFEKSDRYFQADKELVQ